MNRVSTFTFRVSDKERVLISTLAEILQRSQSDAVRLAIRQTLERVERLEKINKIALNPIELEP